MKVIIEGKLPVLEGKCTVCECRIEVPYNRDWVSWFSNGSHSYPHYLCPTEGCGAKIDLYKKGKPYG